MAAPLFWRRLLADHASEVATTGLLDAPVATSGDGEAGLTDQETGAALGVTVRTVRRDWVKAKAWLADALS